MIDKHQQRIDVMNLNVPEQVSLERLRCVENAVDLAEHSIDAMLQQMTMIEDLPKPPVSRNFNATGQVVISQANQVLSQAERQQQDHLDALRQQAADAALPMNPLFKDYIDAA